MPRLSSATALARRIGAAYDDIARNDSGYHSGNGNGSGGYQQLDDIRSKFLAGAAGGAQQYSYDKFSDGISPQSSAMSPLQSNGAAKHGAETPLSKCFSLTSGGSGTCSAFPACACAGGRR